MKKKIPHGVTCAEWGCKECAEELSTFIKKNKLQSRIDELESKITTYDNMIMENPFHEEDKLELKILKLLQQYKD